MNKTFSKILVWINVAVVLILLIFSALIISITTNQKKGLLGYNAKLVIGQKIDNKIGERCLIIVKQADTKNLTNGSYILCSDNGTLNIVKVDSIDKNMVSYKATDGEQVTLDLTLQDYCGIVTFSSNFLGNFVSTFAKAESVSLTFIFIGGIFILSILSLTILYALHMHKKASVKNTENEEKDEYLTQNDDDEDNDNYVFNESSILNATDSDEVSDIYNDTLAKNQKGISPLNDLNCEIAKNDCLININSQSIKTPVAPLYSLDNEDIPSIEDLMSSIDAQFSLANQDFKNSEKLLTKK